MAKKRKPYQSTLIVTFPAEGNRSVIKTIRNSSKTADLVRQHWASRADTFCYRINVYLKPGVRP